MIQQRIDFSGAIKWKNVMKKLQQLMINIAIEEKLERTQDLTWLNNVSISIEAMSFL